MVGVSMSQKIFVGDIHCLAMPPNECAHGLYGHFRQLPPSCLLVQCNSSRLLHFRFVPFQLVFYITLNCTMPLIQFIVLFGVDHKCRILHPRVIRGHSALANDRPQILRTAPAFMVYHLSSVATTRHEEDIL